MLIYAFPEYRRLGQSLAAHPLWRQAGYKFDRYQSGELNLTLLGSVAGQHCLIVGQTAPPDDNLLKLLILADTLRKEGAAKITLLAPYLGYSRQEHNIKNFGQFTQLIGKLLKTAGVSQLITLDLHNPDIIKAFPIKLTNLPSAPLFASIVKKYNRPDLSLASPDLGAYERCASLATGQPIIFFQKKRMVGDLKMLKLHGLATRRIILVDDILSTGETLVKAAKQLIKLGSQEIIILVTHGQFKGKIWRQLLIPQVKKIYSTDSTPDAKQQKIKRLRLLSVNSYLTAYCHKHLH
ncbi:MAG: ribose-phosphate diphosphokinase [Candidatus Falkowbacteria bacterium]